MGTNNPLSGISTTFSFSFPFDADVDEVDKTLNGLVGEYEFED